jgi:WD40 repeat protein
MATPVTHFDTGHSDTVHDTQFDWYGTRVATCSSDGLVRIFAVDREPATYVADLTGHQGPVWQVTWGHPKFGSIVASAGFDHTVIIWKEHQDGSWYILHRTDVNLHTGARVVVACAARDMRAGRQLSRTGAGQCRSLRVSWRSHAWRRACDCRSCAVSATEGTKAASGTPCAR